MWNFDEGLRPKIFTKWLVVMPHVAQKKSMDLTNVISSQSCFDHKNKLATSIVSLWLRWIKGVLLAGTLCSSSALIKFDLSTQYMHLNTTVFTLTYTCASFQKKMVELFLLCGKNSNHSNQVFFINTIIQCIFSWWFSCMLLFWKQPPL